MKRENLPDKIGTLVLYIAILTIITFTLLYFFVFSTSHNIFDSLKILIGSIIPDAILSILAFVIIYLFFIKRGIHAYNQDLAPIIEIKNSIEDTIKPLLENLNSKVLDESSYIHKDLLVTTLGLKRETRKENIFQNFQIIRHEDHEGNINALYYMWADNLFGNKINAHIEQVPRENYNFLRVYFEFNENSWGCNIGVRPRNDIAVANDPFKPYLLFDARIPEESITENDNLQPISISIRVVDRYITHWEYARMPKIMDYVKYPKIYHQFKVNSLTWQTYSISLISDDWLLFHMDGNHYFGNDRPDFTVIPVVVFEFGLFGEGYCRPREGIGSVDIRNITLSTKI